MSTFAPNPAGIPDAPAPTVGQIVHWNIGLAWRPLLVIDVNPENPHQIKGCVYTLLEDQINVDALPKGVEAKKLDRGSRWEVQATPGEEFGSWRWPPRV